MSEPRYGLEHISDFMERFINQLDQANQDQDTPPTGGVFR